MKKTTLIPILLSSSVVLQPYLATATTQGFTNSLSSLRPYVSAGLGLNIGDNHHTSEYQFKPNTANFALQLGAGAGKKVKDKIFLGFTGRYFYNSIKGKVEPNAACNASYTNKVHNILLTPEASFNFVKRKNFDVGINLGAGVNIYQMQLTSDELITGSNWRLDPEKKFKLTFGAFAGIFLQKNISNADLKLSLDYFYLGKLKSTKASRTSGQNDLSQHIGFNKHDVLLSITYIFKGE